MHLGVAVCKRMRSGTSSPRSSLSALNPRSRRQLAYDEFRMVNLTLVFSFKEGLDLEQSRRSAQDASEGEREADACVRGGAWEGDGGHVGSGADGLHFCRIGGWVGDVVVRCWRNTGAV
jgi:hypothetical protein